MSTHDYNLINQTGANLRADINSVLAAIVSQNSSATEPATMFAYMFWMDTTTNTLKQRNSTNTAWIYLHVRQTSATGSAQLPVGTTAERDGTPADGYLRLNSTLTALEAWYSAAWNTIATTANAVLTTGAQTIAGVKTFSDGVKILASSGVPSKLESVTCTQATGALTFGLNPTVLDFRSPTLTTGVPVTRNANTALSLVLPSGGTLGTVTTVQARLILVAIDNAGTVELAVVNIAGGNSLSEEGVINTTAIADTSDSNNVFYSTTARTGVAYRVVGAVDVVNTAGAWGTPVLVQPMGGEALSAMSSFGYGQTWQDVTGIRSYSTTYYNTTGRLIKVKAYKTFSSPTTSTDLKFYLNGVILDYSSVFSVNGGNWAVSVSCEIPHGSYYSIVSTGVTATTVWHELR
jgi:hypothetical protein